MSSIIPIFIPHVGCPHDCIFCNQRKIAGTAYAPTPREVQDEINSALKKIPEQKPQIAFYGGSFTAIEDDLQTAYLQAVQPYLDSGAVSSVRVSTRPDCIDETTLIRLKKYGVGTIELGAQSMSDSVLNAAGRGHTAQDTVDSSVLIKKYGFELILQMMVGLPRDTADVTVKTARAIASLKPDGVRIYPVAVIKDTALAKLWKQGLYTPLNVDEAADRCADILQIFEENKIPVIRIGLNPTEELSGGEVLAGVYHPAFGELVRSKLYLRSAERQLTEKLSGGESLAHVTIFVHPSRISVMIGQHGVNRKRLIEEFSIKRLDISAGKLQDGEIKIVLNNV